MSSFSRPPRNYAFPSDRPEETDAVASHGRDRAGRDEAVREPPGRDRFGYDPASYDQILYSTLASEVEPPTHSWLHLDLVPSWLRPFTLDANTRFTRTPDLFLRPRDVVVAALSCEISNRGWHFVHDPADDLDPPQEGAEPSGILDLPVSQALVEAVAPLGSEAGEAEASFGPAMSTGPELVQPPEAADWLHQEGPGDEMVHGEMILGEAAHEDPFHMAEAPVAFGMVDTIVDDMAQETGQDSGRETGQVMAGVADLPAVEAVEFGAGGGELPDAPAEGGFCVPATADAAFAPGEGDFGAEAVLTPDDLSGIAPERPEMADEATAPDVLNGVPETLLAVGRLLRLGAAARPPEASVEQDLHAGAAGGTDLVSDVAPLTAEVAGPEVGLGGLAGLDEEIVAEAGAHAGDLSEGDADVQLGAPAEAGEALAGPAGDAIQQAEQEEVDEVASFDLAALVPDDADLDADVPLAADEAADEGEANTEGDGLAIAGSILDDDALNGPDDAVDGTAVAASPAPLGQEMAPLVMQAAPADPSLAPPTEAGGASADPWPAVWRPYQQSITARFLGAAGTPGLDTVAPPVPAPAAVVVPAAPAAPAQVDEQTTASDGIGPGYELPPLDLLREPPVVEPDFELSEEFLDQSSTMLQQVLRDFGVRGEVIDANPGPVVTLYEFEPAPGVKSSRVIGLSPDIARSMSAVSTRVAVVEGRNVIGIELPNRRRDTVWLRELLASHEFADTHPKLGLCLGKTIGGVPVIADLARMPHLLVAGTTGSGKSVAINTMILSLLYRHTPEACRLIMIDPKMLELSVYEGIPHLLTPVVTDPKKAIMALKWAVKEMEERYRKMSRLAVRNIDGFNARVKEAAEKGEVITRSVQVGFDKESGEALFEEQEMDLTPLPYIVVIVDEMADLMMVAGKEIEGAIQRLAQMARAAGIHLVMATQRPSVDVITGTIKANFPTRISFQVTSKIDSRTILGEMGAETLLGQGDMLFMAGGGRITRVHGPFVSDGEVEKVVAFLKAQGKPDYLDEVILDEAAEVEDEEDAVFDRSSMADAGGDLYEQAVAIVMRDRKASTSYIQRRLQVGYNKAASLMERMETEGIVGPANHAGKREILTFSRPD